MLIPLNRISGNARDKSLKVPWEKAIGLKRRAFPAQTSLVRITYIESSGRSALITLLQRGKNNFLNIYYALSFLYFPNDPKGIKEVRNNYRNRPRSRLVGKIIPLEISREVSE